MSQSDLIVVAAVAALVYALATSRAKPSSGMSASGIDWSSATVLDKPAGWWDDACAVFDCQP